MTIIESAVEVSKPVAEVYAFLSNMNNHQQL
ncbi:MAG: SRPBCC family protein, partial [Pedobacter sp.]